MILHQRYDRKKKLLNRNPITRAITNMSRVTLQARFLSELIPRSSPRLASQSCEQGPWEGYRSRQRPKRDPRGRSGTPHRRTSRVVRGPGRWGLPRAHWCGPHMRSAATPHKPLLDTGPQAKEAQDRGQRPHKDIAMRRSASPQLEKRSLRPCSVGPP